MGKTESAIHWAPRVAPAKIRRLYQLDAGILDDELLDEVGWALYSRCRSSLRVTSVMRGTIVTPP